MTKPLFNGEVGRGFEQYADDLRGYVRYELVHENLGSLVMGESLRVADVGGGSGIDAIWLAGLGHEVDLVDPAQGQVASTREKLKALPDRTQARRVHVKKGDAQKLLKDGEGQYDLVLSHGVIMYLEEPQERVNELVRLAKPGGHISLLEKGRTAARQRLISAKDFAGLRKLNAGGKIPNRTHLEVHAFSLYELSAYLKSAGAKIVKKGGVRVLSDSIDLPISSFSEQELQAILFEEKRAGSEPTTMGLGQMLHVIAQKL